MKLTNLNPKWIGAGDKGEIIFGLRFDCPHCLVQRLAVIFTPFIDPKGWLPKIGGEFYNDRPKWNRIGDSFENITLRPSINTEFSGHWHGFIENGEIK